ncbi:MAG: ATP-binding cassette domain-containing protein [Coriobacteriia bacterium]|nr:ATP-binding cassette domain-containing protein [Coriobacteriia bacterium]
MSDPVPASSAAPLLEARGLRAVRAGDDGPLVVLDGVDLVLAPGTLSEVTGPSGSGKTTLLLALARLLPGVEGDLVLDGTPAAEIAPHVWRTRVALLPQRPALVPGTVTENLLLPWSLKARHGQEPPSSEALADALAGVGLGGVAADRDVSRLSVGQIARIALLRVMLTGPSVLLLDEPDASLDDASAAEVVRLTGAFVADGGAVVRVSHVRADVSATARYRLEGGRLTVLGGSATPRSDASPSTDRNVSQEAADA